MSLSIADYTKILSFYKIKIPSSHKELKRLATDIMANKLCKCIKSIHTPNNIASCTKSIFKSKGITRGLFKCRKNRTVRMTKKS